MTVCVSPDRTYTSAPLYCWYFKQHDSDGRWLMTIDTPLVRTWGYVCHYAQACAVVDDFGTLVPVEVWH